MSVLRVALRHAYIRGLRYATATNLIILGVDVETYIPLLDSTAICLLRLSKSVVKPPALPIRHIFITLSSVILSLR